METIRVDLPDSLRAFVESSASEGGYVSPGEYVCELIRREQQLRTAREELEELLLAGLNSGPPIPADDEFWAAGKRRLIERAAQLSGAQP